MATYPSDAFAKKFSPIHLAITKNGRILRSTKVANHGSGRGEEFSEWFGRIRPGGYKARFSAISSELLANLTGSFDLARESHYVDGIRQDCPQLLEVLQSISRPAESSLVHELEPVVAGGGALDAWIKQEEDRFEIGISLGMFMALTDLSMRLACNSQFFSFGAATSAGADSEWGRLWGGCECIWTRMTAGRGPKLRFNDYHQVSVDDDMGYLSGYIEGIPCDGERISMACFLTSWILLHEEGHYCSGHFHYLGHHLGADGMGLGETGKQRFAPQEVPYRTVFEWQADRGATRGVVDVFFQSAFLAIVPSYVKEDREKWLLRLIFVGIGLVIQMLQKSQVISGAESYYPTLRTRLIGASISLMGRAANPPNWCIQLSIPVSGNPVSVFSPVLAGGFEDLSVVADLINRDGDVVDFEFGAHPVVDPSRRHGLLDEPNEGGTLFKLVWLVNLVENGGDFPEEFESLRPLYEEWCGEYIRIVRLHDQTVYDELNPFRRMTGDFVD